MIRSAKAALSNAHRNASRLRTSYRGNNSNSLRRSFGVNPARALLRSSSSTTAAAASCGTLITSIQSSSSQSNSSSSSRLALATATAAAAAILTNTLSNNNNNKTTPTQNESAHLTQQESGHNHSNANANHQHRLPQAQEEQPDMGLRALGKSLQASHERQMVRMAKLLHSLETLAEEAEKQQHLQLQRAQQQQQLEGNATAAAADNDTGKRQEDGQAQANQDQAVAKGEASNNAKAAMIRMTDADLADLTESPEAVWAHIDALKSGSVYGREDAKRIARAASTLLRGEGSLIDLSARCGGRVRRRRSRRRIVRSRESGRRGTHNNTSSAAANNNNNNNNNDTANGTTTGTSDTDSDEDAGRLKTVTVVGDLHGHFQDSLCKVLDMLDNNIINDDKKESKDYNGDDDDEDDDNNNNDSDKRAYCASPWNGDGAVVFNGDFVDRGHNSIEVLLALLLLKLAYPNNVYLNRGNHEDSVIATVYGCSDELKSRYGTDDHDVHDIWKEFEDVFASLPLAVKTDSAVIMHGGLPCDNFSLDQIAQITSEERFAIKTMVEPGKDDDTCKLVQNIMWSDPQPESGITPNEDRGCGVKYGPDVVHKFLSDHGLKYLIRSHEPVDAGYELLECDEHGMSAVTIFSAASYPGGAGFNYGAIVRLHCDDGGDATFDSYGESSGDGQHDQLTTREKMSHTFKAFADVVASNRAALKEEFEYLAGVRARRVELQLRFRYSRPDSEYAGNAVATSAVAANNDAVMITPEQWADAMSYVLSGELPNVDWLNIQRFIAPGDLIDYKRFLNLHCNLSGYSDSHSAGMDDDTRDTILKNHEAIIKVFKFLDVDGDGEVDREEFCRGIDELKKRNTEGALSFDAEALFDSIDIDKSGTIELTEFQHAFQACDVPYHVAVMMALDEDKSGTIDRHEFRDGVHLLNARLADKDKIPESESEIDRLFDELDESGDGELDMEEFEKFVRVYYPH